MMLVLGILVLLVESICMKKPVPFLRCRSHSFSYSAKFRFEKSACHFASNPLNLGESARLNDFSFKSFKSFKLTSYYNKINFFRGNTEPLIFHKLSAYKS